MRFFAFSHFFYNLVPRFSLLPVDGYEREPGNEVAFFSV